VDDGRQIDPLEVIDADERKLQQPVKALLGLDVDMAAPRDVGERTSGDP
jgi:hypothetical protein